MIFRLFKREQPRKKEQVGKIGTGDSSEGSRKVEIGLNFDGDPTTPANSDLLPQNGRTVRNGDPVYTKEGNGLAFQNTVQPDSAIVAELVRNELAQLTRYDLRATEIQYRIARGNEKLRAAREAFNVQRSSELYRAIESLRGRLTEMIKDGFLPVPSEVDEQIIQSEILKLYQTKETVEGADAHRRIDDTIQFLETTLQIKNKKAELRQIDESMALLRQTPIMEMDEAQTDQLLALSTQKGDYETRLQLLIAANEALLNQKREIA